jgi:hypothetical protein
MGRVIDNIDAAENSNGQALRIHLRRIKQDAA